MYWKITPTHNDDIDYYAVPAGTESDHRHALELAQEILESQWDALLLGETGTVSIMLCEEAMPELIDDSV